jgi:hypothetical protein
MYTIRRATVQQTHGKEQGECFGMLIVPWKYLRQEFQMLKFDFK